MFSRTNSVGNEVNEPSDEEKPPVTKLDPSQGKKPSLEESQSDGVTEKVENGSSENDRNQNDKQPIDPAKVSKYLRQHPLFMDMYVNSRIGLPTLSDWLRNKEMKDGERAAEDSCRCRDREQTWQCCPNASLLAHFAQGQDGACGYAAPHCCTCTQLPIGSRRFYIIYALDADDSSNGNPSFTVPRAMTNNEMWAFSNRYGFDLQRRMNMYM